MTNHNKHKHNEQWKLEANTRNRRKARENASYQVAIGFGFASDWLSWWREFFKPITERSKAKPKQFRITFDTQLKTALEQWLSLVSNQVLFVFWVIIANFPYSAYLSRCLSYLLYLEKCLCPRHHLHEVLDDIQTEKELEKKKAVSFLLVREEYWYHTCTELIISKRCCRVPTLDCCVT